VKEVKEEVATTAADWSHCSRNCADGQHFGFAISKKQVIREFLDKLKVLVKDGRIVKSDIENFTPAVAQTTADAPTKTETVCLHLLKGVSLPEKCLRKKLRIPNAQDYCKTIGRILFTTHITT
jgi:hypothetical protein